MRTSDTYFGVAINGMKSCYTEELCQVPSSASLSQFPPTHLSHIHHIPKPPNLDYRLDLNP